ncbi:MAG: hypothetical protein AB9873_02430 [Syntrophobacteraceae bacterium]
MAETAVRKRRVTGRLRLNRWLKILRELASYDATGDLRRSRAKWGAGISGGAFIALLVLFFCVLGEDELVCGALGIGALIALGLIGYFLKKLKQLGALDLANDFRTVLLPFLVAIREDVPTMEKVKLNLDLAGPSETKVIRKGDLGKKDGKDIEETVYSDPWCHLEAPLAAGNRITLDIANTYTRHQVRWRTTRGKNKSKCKWRKLVVVRAAMAPDAARFMFDPVALKKGQNEVGLKVKKRADGEAVVITMKKKIKFVGNDPPADSSIQTKEIVAMFLRLGSLIRPIPTGSQPT